MRRAALPRSSGVALALIALAGCDSFPPLPVITGVTPSSGRVDESHLVQVTGTGFAVRVFTDFDDPDQSRTDDTYQIFIGGLELTGVQHISPTQLTGTLPDGVPDGLNDVSVIDPWARTATLAGAFFGTPAGGPPTSLAIVAPPQVALGTCQAVTVEQRNDDGTATVSLNPTAVALAATPGTAFGIFGDSGCANAVTSTTIDTGQTSAVVYVQTTTRGTATLAASATGLTPDTHSFVFGPTALAFTSGPFTIDIGVCLPNPVTVVTRAPSGAASAVATDTVVSLAVSPSSNFSIYDAPGCGGSPVNQITIPAGGSSAGFFFRGTVAGNYQVTASSPGLSNASQTQTLSPGANTFSFAPIATQAVHTPFLVTIEMLNPLGSPVPTFAGTATLSGQGGTTITCASNCGGTSASTSAFLQGKWSGWVTASAATPGAALRAVSGTASGTSAAFQVLAPDAGLGVPNARLSVSPGAVDNVNDTVFLDARLSSDYDGGTAALLYSFDALGTATTAAGVSPWTSWSSTATATGTGYGTGTIWHPRVAVRQSANPNAIAYASATVASVNGTLCVVDTASLSGDGASDCGTPYRPGPDGFMSLTEAISLVNSGNARGITTSSALRFSFDAGVPVQPVSGSSASWLSFATGTQLINAPLDFTGPNALLANVEVSGARALTASAGDLRLNDVVAHDFPGFAIRAPVSLLRMLAFNCPPAAPCVDVVGPNGMLSVRAGDFRDSPGGAIRVAPATTGGPCQPGALDVVSSTFLRSGTAVTLDCTSGSSVVHSTFHGNQTGISYAGGTTHTLQNAAFTGNATAASCGTATFTAKDYNLVSSNMADGCAGGDANTLTTDPLYFLPEAGDLRVRSSSPARDSAFDLGLDVTDSAPGNFFGAGPDRGGRETP